MTRPTILPVERVALLGAMAACVVAAVWWWREQPALAALRRPPPAAVLHGGAFVPPSLTNGAAAREVAAGRTWRRPEAQSSGAGWVYEVFTPPVIYYHAGAKAFAVTPPEVLARGPAVAAEGDAAFGLELLAVKREPYRLQLAGYFGAPGNYLGAFVSHLVPETLLGRAGKRFAQLQLALLSLEIRKFDLASDEPVAAYEMAAVAVVHDEQAGADVTLDSRAPTYTETPLAVLRLGLGAEAREYHEGEILREAAATYRIERIQLDPPEVVVARELPGLPHPELRLLRPPAAEGVVNRDPVRRAPPGLAAGRGPALATQPARP